nr:hypothetical protein [Halomonas socia]
MLSVSDVPKVASLNRGGLALACYRQAGHLVAMECSGAGGWFLVWEHPRPASAGISHPSMCSACPATPEWHAIISMAGVAAELFHRGDWLNGEDLLQASDGLGVWSGRHQHVVRSIAPSMADYTLELVASEWESIARYARDAIDQWQRPDALDRYHIDRLYPPGGAAPPDHFAPALRPGQPTCAALVESIEPAGRIPASVRA